MIEIKGRAKCGKILFETNDWISRKRYTLPYLTLEIANVPLILPVVQNNMFTIVYDFSGFKEFTVYPKNKALIKLMEKEDIERECSKEKQ